MKDLLLYTADAQAFMRGLMGRPEALGIRSIAHDIDRHLLHDSGMVQNGAELTRMRKGRYRKALLMWDHQGSGLERQTPEEVAREMQARLDRYTWKDHSAVAVLVPELEQWLWFCETAIVSHFGATIDRLRDWTQEWADRMGQTLETARSERPKELFAHVVRNHLRRSILPRDFEKMGKLASVKALEDCPSFQDVLRPLRAWFAP